MQFTMSFELYIDIGMGYILNNGNIFKSLESKQKKGRE